MLKIISESTDLALRKKLKTERRENLRKIYTYKSDPEGIKYALCITCLRSTGFEEIIKMKDGNTSGLKSHLNKIHPELFEEIYGASNSSVVKVMQ